MLTLVIGAPEIRAWKVAPLPSGLKTVTVGGVVYPDPPLDRVAPVIEPDDVVVRFATAVAPLPPPPESVTVGAELYPRPGEVTFTPITWFPDVPWQLVP